MKNLKSKIFSTAAVISILASNVLLPDENSFDLGGKVFAENDGAFTYESYSGGVCITGFSGSGEINIPETIDEKPVLKISRLTVSANITSISIPKTVAEIEPSFVYAESWLSEIKVSEENQSFTVENGFLMTKDKTRVILYPAQKQDEKAVLPDTAKTIDDDAFCDGKFSYIELPEGLETIGARAFQNCQNLVEISIPASVAEIGDGAFSGCSMIKYEVNPDNRNYCSFEDVLFTKNKEKLIKYPAKKSEQSYSIPPEVREIKSCAFEGSYNLKSIEFPKNGNLTLIEHLAFGSCYNLTSAEFPEGITKIDHSVFWYANNLSIVTLPVTLNEINSSCFGGCDKLNTIIAGNNINITSYSTDYTENVNIVKYEYQSGLPVITDVKIGEGKSSICIPETIGGKDVSHIVLAEEKVSQATVIVPEKFKDDVPANTAKITYKEENGVVTITSVTPAKDESGKAKPVALPEAIGNKKPFLSEEAMSDMKEVPHNHCGGTATYTEKAKCEICGQEYGDLLYKPAETTTSGSEATQDTTTSESEVTQDTTTSESEVTQDAATSESEVTQNTASEPTITVIQTAQSAEIDDVPENSDDVTIISGLSGDIRLEVKESRIPDGAIAEYLAENPKWQLVKCYDLNLFSTDTQIRQSETEITVRFNIPEKLKSKALKFAILRIHEGNAELLPDVDDRLETVTIKTDKFSQYALVYKSADETAETFAAQELVSDKDKNLAPYNPSTGSLLSFIPAVLSAVAVMAAKKKRK